MNQARNNITRDMVMDVLASNHSRIITLCSVAVKDALLLYWLSDVDLPIDLGDHDHDMIGFYNLLGVVFLSFSPKIDGCDCGFRVKCSIDYSKWKVKDVFIENNDGGGAIDCFCYDDWSDKYRRKMIHLGLQKVA